MFTTAGISFFTSGANDSGAVAALDMRGKKSESTIRGSATLISNLMNDLRIIDSITTVH
jgi:hypothetical protein